MRKVVLFLLLVILLSGCVSAPQSGADPVQPYYDASYANATLESARITAAAANAVLTATVESQRYQATQEAARSTQKAVSAQATQAQQSWQATATAEAGFMRATAAYQSTQDALGVMQTTQAIEEEGNRIAYDHERQLLDLERRATANKLLGVLPALFWIVVIGIVLFAAVQFTRAEILRRAVIHRPDRSPIVLGRFRGNTYIIDPDRSLLPISSIHAPAAPIPVQAQITSQAQQVELGAHVSRYGKKTDIQIPDYEPLPQLVETPHIIESAFPEDAPWRLLDNWSGSSLILGMGAAGPIMANPETTPHLLMAGTSGSGKTRFGLRPLIAEWLADNGQVSIFDRSGIDFYPFADHPNANLVILNNTAPVAIIEYLRSLYEELQRRLNMMFADRASTWKQMVGAGPRVLAVIDEFSNLADAMPTTNDRNELWRYARMIAAEGRKAGIHLAIALQDPTHKSLDLRIRRNASPLAFRVQDDTASRVVLGAPGADQLGNRQFMTVINANLQHGMAFAPTDQEIADFLRDRSVKPLPSPAWLKNVDSTVSVETGTTDIVQLVELIRPAWMRGESKRAMARLAGKEYAGSFTTKIDQAIEILENSAATTYETADIYCSSAVVAQE